MSIAPGQIVTQDRDLYRVDGYLMDPDAIPADIPALILEMKYHSEVRNEKPLCLLTYSDGWLQCTPGTEEYDNRDEVTRFGVRRPECRERLGEPL